MVATFGSGQSNAWGGYIQKGLDPDPTITPGSGSLTPNTTNYVYLGERMVATFGSGHSNAWGGFMQKVWIRILNSKCQ